MTVLALRLAPARVLERLVCEKREVTNLDDTGGIYLYYIIIYTT